MIPTRRRRWMDALVAIAVVAAIPLSLSLSGCACTKTNPTAGPSTGEKVTATPTVEATVTTLPTATVEPTVAPLATAKGLPYTPGPDETGTNFAYVKSLSIKNGYVYAVVDYILIGEGPDGWFITNNNPKLRTFPLAKTCPCRYLIQGTSNLSGPLMPLAFRSKWASSASSKMIRRNPYKVTVKHGVITKFDNEWLP